jgi:hypothetical protein
MFSEYVPAAQDALAWVGKGDKHSQTNVVWYSRLITGIGEDNSWPRRNPRMAPIILYVVWPFLAALSVRFPNPSAPM